MKELFAVLALGVSLAANVPYVIEIVKGEVKPERISWLLWTILGGVYFFSTIVDEGATLFTLGELLAPIVIFCLSLKYGVGGKSRFDLISLAIALASLSLLLIVNGALVSLLLALFVDAIGITLTVRKLKLDPTSESRMFWIMAGVSGVFALLSLESYSLVAILFPLYVVIISTVVSVEIHRGRPHPERIEQL